MCGICGCGQTDSAALHHSHQHGNDPHHTHNHHSERIIQLEQDILSKNDHYAAQNRSYFEQHGIFALNLVSSPGAGKTTLLVETIQLIKEKASIYVIEGDQQTEHDADRIRATGISARQINTGKACHLDAHDIGHAVQDLQVTDNSLLAIENVGNLVCPSSFDLGEAHKVVVLSVTEGDDKPLKYPDMFHAADLMIINKIDLLPYVDFNVERCIEYAKRINPEIKVMQLAATKAGSLTNWVDWLLGNLKI